MGNPVVVEGISKRYSLGAGGGYRRLTETLADLARRTTRSVTRAEIWALDDVSFEVAEGEVLGLIGRNGAGKSTLLKVLSRITEPTAGRAIVSGRLGSLLEIGTGFHPELTGRDNIYLNGAVLGMRRRDIESRFDEIVAFADVAGFLDTPVKRYSSGMYVRLAFAVAAHLEPEILIVDEVLAVGDVEFQKRCLGKLSDVARSGRTVLFVSHNMGAVNAMCDRVVVLDAGRVDFDGPVRHGVERYLAAAAPQSEVPLRERTDRTGSGSARLTGMRLSTMDGGVIVAGSRLSIELEYEADAGTRHLAFAIGIFDEFGAEVYFLDSEVVGGFEKAPPPTGRVRVVTGPINLTPGRAYLNVAMVSGSVADGGELLDRVERAMTIDVEDGDFFGTGRSRDRNWSLCVLEQKWTVDAHG